MRFWSSYIVSISVEDMRAFSQLQHLQFHENRFTTLDGDLFSFNPLLNFLYLGFNQIEHIGHGLLTNLDKLRHLDLGGNLCISAMAFNRAEVEELALQLSVLCPPLGTTTSTATTAISTTTGQPNEQCSCFNEIEDLREFNQQQNDEIAELKEKNLAQDLVIQQIQRLNDDMEARLLEVEMKLREISSTPCSD